MNIDMVRQTLEELESVRTKYLLSRLGKVGLADADGLIDAKLSALGSFWAEKLKNPDSKLLKAYMESIEPEPADENNDMTELPFLSNPLDSYDDADARFVDRLHELFEPVDGIYRLNDVTDQTFAVYRYSDRRNPKDIGNVMELIGCHFNEDGSYSSVKEIIDSSKGGRPETTREYNLTPGENDILDRALLQLVEVTKIINAETDGMAPRPGSA